MKKTTLLSSALCAVMFASGVAWADSSLAPPSGGSGAAAGSAEQHSGAAAADAFGLLSQDYWLGATQFMPRTPGDALDYVTFYYWSASAGTGTAQYEAQVNLPAGALVATLECFFFDSSAADGNVGFWRHHYNYSTDTPSATNVTTVSSSGTGGYQKPFQGSLNETIRYRDGDLRNIYTLIASLPRGDSNVRLRGCRFFWNRQISPAPVAATFTDVPTSHQFFQHIEALRDSGVTSGCTATTYCPNDPVTRAQMAAFLSRFGGLHWPF